MNWKIPTDVSDQNEIQNLQVLWFCKNCGGSGTSSSIPQSCGDCGSEEFSYKSFIQPAGFAVDFDYKPHNRIADVQYLPVRKPLISLTDSSWGNLPSRLGRYRVNAQSRVIHYNSGADDKGYALCLECGRMAPKTEFLKDHKHLRVGSLKKSKRYARHSEVCKGNAEGGKKIKEGLSLGVANLTQAFELQIFLRDGVEFTEAGLYSIAVAMRQALCEQLGVAEEEIAPSVDVSRDPQNQSITSIYLYDTASGGAGYATQAVGDLTELFRQAAKKLQNCPRNCDKACHACLLSYDTQHQHEFLDRNAAKAILDVNFLNALELCSEDYVFGPET